MENNKILDTSNVFGPKYNDMFDPKYNEGGIASGTVYLNNYNNPPTKINVLKSNKKTLFYYWSGNCCFYSLYEGQDEIVFTESYNFVKVLEELGMLKK